jgi:hypothetical protein
MTVAKNKHKKATVASASVANVVGAMSGMGQVLAFPTIVKARVDLRMQAAAKPNADAGKGAYPDPLTVARYVLGRGWKPVPVPVGKSPKLPKWQLLEITAANVEQYFKNKKLNVGAQMGPMSSGLTDVDLDCAEAITLAPYFLPQTAAVYGRPSKLRSHWLYCIGDPLPKAWIKLSDDQDKVIVELRMGGGGKGAQSVMPGSMHPSGEYYEWDNGDGEPAQAACEDLKKAVFKLAAAVLLMRHWPTRGGLHDAALGVSSFLARAGWKDAEIAQLIFAVCHSLGRGDKAKSLAMARDSIERLEKGEEVRGLPFLQEVFGRDVAEKIAKLVGFFQQETTAIGEVSTEGVSLTDFYANMQQHNYVFAPSRDIWPTESINSRFPPVVIGVDDEGEPVTISPSRWLDQHQPIEQMTWAPGMDTVIRDFLISDGGWIPRKGVSLFNMYRPGTIELGDANKARPWIKLVHKVFPSNAEHIIKWLAQRVQHPEIKINHGLLGSQFHGIGKDTLLEPVKRTLGSWNFKEVSAKNMFGNFNPWVRAVILRVSEVKDMGDVTRFELYEGMKSYMAAPPDALECNEKNLKQHYVLNVMGVIITTNHLTDGIYLPAEDRRHYVAWSECTPEDFTKEYWTEMWKWYNEGGDEHVAAYLTELDISDFDPKAPPPKTPAFWSIVNANRTSEESELADALDKLGEIDKTGNVVWADAVTLEMIKEHARAALKNWMNEHHNRKAVSHRLEACGYRAVNNPAAKDGYWRVNDRRCVIYAKITLTEGKQREAAAKLQREAEKEAAKLAAEEEAARLQREKRDAKMSAAMKKNARKHDSKIQAGARKARVAYLKSEREREKLPKGGKPKPAKEAG